MRLVARRCYPKQFSAHQCFAIDIAAIESDDRKIKLAIAQMVGQHVGLVAFHIYIYQRMGTVEAG